MSHSKTLSPIIPLINKRYTVQKLVSGNQKLNFNKSLDNLTPRSKALFFSLCKSPPKKVTIIKTQSPTFPPKNLEYFKNNQNKIVPELIENNNDPQSTSSLNNLNEIPKVPVMKLTIKEISEVIRVDTINSVSENKICTKNYMKDLNKYTVLLQTKIKPTSPRTRQALLNLTYDPDIFTHFSFEEFYNANIGRLANVKKYMEYMSSKASDFLGVIEERSRLMRLERDLNKKFINDNISSKNFSDSIFHVKTFKIAEDQMEKLYYNNYFSPESRKRLNIAQKEFDTKILQNRSNFVNFQKKLDFVISDIKNKERRKSNYYQSWEENIKRIEKNKETMIDQKKKKALDYIEKVKQKHEEIKKTEKEKQKELEEKALEMTKKLVEETQLKQKKELKRYYDIGIKDKKREEQVIFDNEIKLVQLKEDYKEISAKLKKIDEKTNVIFNRKNDNLEIQKDKLKYVANKRKDSIQKLKTLGDQTSEDYLETIQSRYQEKYEKILTSRSKELNERTLSAKKKNNMSFTNLKFNQERLNTISKDKNNALLEKLDNDDMKSEKSAELRKKKINEIIQKKTTVETKVLENYLKELENVRKKEERILNKHSKSETKNKLRSIETLIILEDVKEKQMEASQFKIKLLKQSL